MLYAGLVESSLYRRPASGFWTEAGGLVVDPLDRHRLPRDREPGDAGGQDSATGGARDVLGSVVGDPETTMLVDDVSAPDEAFGVGLLARALRPVPHRLGAGNDISAGRPLIAATDVVRTNVAVEPAHGPKDTVASLSGDIEAREVEAG